MKNNYSEEEVKLAKELLSNCDYNKALHEFIHKTNSSYQYANTLLCMIQKGE
ncbi:MAG: hypothetical protein MRZ66_03325 [Clostridiales bacterium]|nr:hypothetical protein [Clostridiales bacterium]